MSHPPLHSGAHTHAAPAQNHKMAPVFGDTERQRSYNEPWLWVDGARKNASVYIITTSLQGLSSYPSTKKSDTRQLIQCTLGHFLYLVT